MSNLSVVGSTIPISQGIYVPSGTFNGQIYYFCSATQVFVFYDLTELGYILSTNMLGEGILGQHAWLTCSTHGTDPDGTYTNTGGGGSGSAVANLTNAIPGPYLIAARQLYMMGAQATGISK